MVSLCLPRPREEEVEVNSAHAQATQYLTIKEVCSRRKCSRSTLFEELRRQKLSCEKVSMPSPFKLGRRTYFVEAEVEEWLQTAVANARNQK